MENVVVGNEYVKASISEEVIDSTDLVTVEVAKVREAKKMLHTYGMSGVKEFKLCINENVYYITLEYDNGIHMDHVIGAIDDTMKVLQGLEGEDAVSTAKSLKSSIFNCLAKIKDKAEQEFNDVPVAPEYKSSKEKNPEEESTAVDVIEDSNDMVTEEKEETEECDKELDDLSINKSDVEAFCKEMREAIEEVDKE